MQEEFLILAKFFTRPKTRPSTNAIGRIFIFSFVSLLNNSTAIFPLGICKNDRSSENSKENIWSKLNYCHKFEASFLWDCFHSFIRKSNNFTKDSHLMIIRWNGKDKIVSRRKQNSMFRFNNADLLIIEIVENIKSQIFLIFRTSKSRLSLIFKKKKGMHSKDTWKRWMLCILRSRIATLTSHFVIELISWSLNLYLKNDVI